MSEDGVINSISIYHNGGSGNMLLAVYSDDDGEPYYRSAITESKAVNSTAGWQTVELTQYLKVEAGDTIWLAWVFESNPGTRYTSGSPSKAVSSQYWAGQMPQEFGSSSSSSYIYSICANYSPAQAQQELTLIGNPYMFTAREYDIETGLYYYRARYYNPYIGRFLQTDPAYQGMNWYAYCGNDPLNYTDPMGLWIYGPIDIPVGMVWDYGETQSFPDSVCMSEVSAFLKDTGFLDRYNAALHSATYVDGYYRCYFDVCDIYYSWEMEIEDESGIPALAVTANGQKSIFKDGVIITEEPEPEPEPTTPPIIAGTRNPWDGYKRWRYEQPRPGRGEETPLDEYIRRRSKPWSETDQDTWSNFDENRVWRNKIKPGINKMGNGIIAFGKGLVTLGARFIRVAPFVPEEILRNAGFIPPLPTCPHCGRRHPPFQCPYGA
jgi:RHS repeat-associated protein